MASELVCARRRVDIFNPSDDVGLGSSLTTYRVHQILDIKVSRWSNFIEEPATQLVLEA